MKIDYVNFERKNQNHTKYCKFSDFDRERIQPVEEFDSLFKEYESRVLNHSAE